MTIRHLLKRRSDRYAGCTSAFLLAAGIAASFLPRIFPIRFAFAAIIAIVVIAAFWSLYETPCPVCGKALGAKGLRAALGGLQRSSPACPHCQTGFDAALPAPTPNRD